MPESDPTGRAPSATEAPAGPVTTEVRPPASALGGRLVWMDLMRGAAIVVVLLHHAMVLSMRHLPAVPPGAAAVDAALVPLRMPAMVFLSGLLLDASLRKGSRSYAEGKLRNIAYPYAVWTLLYVLVLDRQWTADPGIVPTLLGTNLLTAPSPLWFLLFLLLFYAAALGLRRVRAPHGVVVVGSLILSMGLQDDTRPSRFFYLFAFFMLGAWASARTAEWDRLVRDRAVLAVAAVLGAVLITVAVVSPYIGRYDAEYAVGVVAGIVLLARGAQLVAGQRWTAGLRALGRHSLIPYVVHYPVMVLVAATLARYVGLEHTSVVVTLTFLAGLAAGALAIVVRLRVPAAAWLFGLPRLKAGHAADEPLRGRTDLAGSPRR